MVNRCDSIDALMYAYYEMMRIKEENQMLEKNKNCIEFSAHSMSLTHRPYQEDTEIAITGMIPGHETLTEPNPFNILCDVVMVSKRYFDRLQTENEQLKQKINEFRDDISGRSTVIESYKRDIKKWQKETGCPSPSAAKSIIESAISWHHAYNEVIDKNRKLEEENADLYAEIRKWKDSTKCEKPEAAATWITSYESACGRGNRLAEMVEKLKEEVYSWKNVTGYSTPEDYMHARISGAFHTPFDYTASWQIATEQLCCGRDLQHALQVDFEYYRTLSTTQAKSIYCWKEATGCDTPDKAKSRIEGLENAVRLINRNMIKEIESNIDEWQKLTGCDSPQKAGCKINDLCDEICKLKGDYDHLLKLTGYKTEQDIRVLLNDSEQFVYKDMRELINSLKRKAKVTESNWQKVTGFSIPEKCSSYIDRLEKKLEDIKNLTEED